LFREERTLVKVIARGKFIENAQKPLTNVFNILMMIDIICIAGIYSMS